MADALPLLSLFGGCFAVVVMLLSGCLSLFCASCLAALPRHLSRQCILFVDSDLRVFHLLFGACGCSLSSSPRLARCLSINLPLFRVSAVYTWSVDLPGEDLYRSLWIVGQWRRWRHFLVKTLSCKTLLVTSAGPRLSGER